MFLYTFFVHLIAASLTLHGAHIILPLGLACWRWHDELSSHIVTEFVDGISSPALCQWQSFNREQTGGQEENLNYNLVLSRALDTPDHNEIRISLPLDAL